MSLFDLHISVSYSFWLSAKVLISQVSFNLVVQSFQSIKLNEDSNENLACEMFSIQAVFFQRLNIGSLHEMQKEVSWIFAAGL